MEMGSSCVGLELRKNSYPQALALWGENCQDFRSIDSTALAINRQQTNIKEATVAPDRGFTVYLCTFMTSLNFLIGK
jgi:hypothetical protein